MTCESSIGFRRNWIKFSVLGIILTRLNGIDPGYTCLLGKRIKAFGSDSQQDCNDYLKKEGFSIPLGPFQGFKPVGGVGILQVGAKWKFEGREDELRVLNDQTGNCDRYPAALDRRRIESCRIVPTFIEATRLKPRISVWLCDNAWFS